MAGAYTVDGLAALYQVDAQDQTWVRQPAQDGSAERFRMLVNGSAAGEAATIPQPTSVAEAARKLGWDDVFNREALLRELNKMNGLPLVELPAASAKIMVMSAELGLKTQTVRDATKNTEESIKNMLNG